MGFLIGGVLTSWLLGFGLLLILAAGVCGFIGLFRQQVRKSILLLIATFFLGILSCHVAAISCVFAYNAYHAAPGPPGDADSLDPARK